MLLLPVLIITGGLAIVFAIPAIWNFSQYRAEMKRYGNSGVYMR
jgi:hypothetical protein